MSTPAHEDPSPHQARALFEAQIDALDGATATALRARRREALAKATRQGRSTWWWPASGIATAALAVVLWLPRPDAPTPGTAPVTSPPGSPPAAGPSDDPATDAARFADTALVELEDDAEFYAWLATVPDDAGTPFDTPAPPVPGPHEGLTL
jgi:hypothetical protein